MSSDIFHKYPETAFEGDKMTEAQLVTGGSGFIGSHLVDTLVERGDSVVNFDQKQPRLGAKPHRYVMGDISLNKNLENIVPHRIDTVYHLAARPWCMVKNADEWFKESLFDFITNVRGTYNVLRQTDSDLFIMASTSALYGDGHKFKETAPLDISSPYAYSKAIAERIVSESGKRYVILRFGSVIGTRGRVFPNRLIWCAVNRIPVVVFNNGNNSRDLIDVRDIVSALMCSSKLNNGIYNVSCGIEINSRELVEIVSGMAEGRGYKLNYEFTDFKLPGLVPCSTLDNSKMLATGEWKPTIALEQSIEDMFRYYESPNSIEPPRWDRV